MPSAIQFVMCLGHSALIILKSSIGRYTCHQKYDIFLNIQQNKDNTWSVLYLKIDPLSRKENKSNGVLMTTCSAMSLCRLDNFEAHRFGVTIVLWWASTGPPSTRSTSNISCVRGTISCTIYLGSSMLTCRCGTLGAGPGAHTASMPNAPTSGCMWAPLTCSVCRDLPAPVASHPGHSSRPCSSLCTHGDACGNGSVRI
jgi:hypothetical protein